MEAKDFTLKFEIKGEGTGGSGLPYRSRTGLPASQRQFYSEDTPMRRLVFATRLN